MSDKLVADEHGNPEEGVPAYEPPALTVIGNARVLLAGNFGSVADADPDNPSQPAH